MNLSKQIFKALLFSTVSALALYLPFYYFAPLYRSLYEHVNLDLVNWWFRWTFSQHNGIQIYIAYGLMYAVLGLALLLDFAYSKFPPQVRWLILGTGVIGTILYFRSIGFNLPTSEDANIHTHKVWCALIAVAIAFVCGLFFENKIVRWLLAGVLALICLVPVQWANLPIDYYYFFVPALRTINGHALNQSYFQYDHLMTFLAMGWMRLHLALDRFYVIVEFLYLIFFFCIYGMARKFFLNNQLVFWFMAILVLTKVYVRIADNTAAPQVCPLRLDLWLALMALAFWKGPQHWSIGLALAGFLVFHHAFGMIYSISYLCLAAVLSGTGAAKAKQFSANLAIMAGGMLINHFFVSSNKTIAALNYVKYNIGFMPIDPKSFFWYVPVMMAMAFLVLWKSRQKLSQPYFQAGLFLLFLVIGNLLYFFGRSHDDNLLNLSAGLLMVFFMLVDMVMVHLPGRSAGIAKKIFVPLMGLTIIGVLAYFYSDRIVDRVKKQAANLPKISEVFVPDQGVELDLRTVKAVTAGSQDVIFVSTLHDLEYYYAGHYTPPAFTPFERQIFMKDVMDTLNTNIAQGAYLIVPQKEFKPLIETVLLIKAKYIYPISNFVYISNNPPAQ